MFCQLKAETDNIMVELEACRTEGHNYNSEVHRIEAAYKETMEQLDVVHIERTRIWWMRSRIFYINLEIKEIPSLSWTNREGDQRSRKRNCRVL